MCSNGSFQTTSLQELDSNLTSQTMKRYQPSSPPLDDWYTFLTTDSMSVSTDSLSPLSYGSLSGDEEASHIRGKRRRSYNSSPHSPKRFKGGACNIIDEVIIPHSPESGIALSPPMTAQLCTQNPGSGVWINILEQPEEYYRARYASEGSRGPLKGRSPNSFPKVKLMLEGNTDHISASISVSLVQDDLTSHGVCSLAVLDEDGPSNVVKKVTAPDFVVEFDQLRVKRERCTGGGKGKMKGKPQKQNESVGYLLFHAVIKTASGQFTCQARSDAIKLTSKPESAELHAIKNEYGSVNGGDEVWIRGSKMIGNPSVYFEIVDQFGKHVKRYAGEVVRDECHQNLLVVKTPKVPFTEQVCSQVVVVTGKDKLRSNTLQFTFIPNGAHPGIFYQAPVKSPVECIVPQSSTRLSPCYSPQPPTPSSTGCFTADDLPFFPSTPPANAFEGMLDICVQQLDQRAEEELLLTAVLPAVSSSITVQELDEKEEPVPVVLPANSSCFDLQELDKQVLPPPPTILLPVDSSSVAVQGTSQPYH